MLKKIPVSQARVGMHLHKLEGAWLNHPFWKTKFTITDPEDLRKLQSSGVPFLWIDDVLGLDVLPVPAGSDTAPVAATPCRSRPSQCHRQPALVRAAERTCRPQPWAKS